MAGHFQPPVSRRTTAMVDMHCIANAKKTSSATAPPGDKSLPQRVPQTFRFRCAFLAVDGDERADNVLESRD